MYYEFNIIIMYDDINNCGHVYRPVANVVSNDPLVRGIVDGVEGVLMHGATLLYGSQSVTSAADVNPVALENNTITSVIPLLHYSPTAYIHDSNGILPIAHTNYQNGSFVACTMEINAGPEESNLIIVSGSTPYGSYAPMCMDEYYNVTLDGHTFVTQAIEFGFVYTHPQDNTVIILGLVVTSIIALVVVGLLYSRRKT
ncbi:MAG: hypothetical protein RTU30_11135 [Candidatus Thorarchaeota archaeon]